MRWHVLDRWCPGLALALVALPACDGGAGSGPGGATLARLVLTPESAVLSAGSFQQFEVSGRLPDGSEVGAAATYSATGGSVSPSGLFTAGPVPGVFLLIATELGGALADTSAITIVDPPSLAVLELTPDSVVLTAGAGQAFSVVGRLSDGSTAPVAVTYEASGGSITPYGYFTARLAEGAFQVVASTAGGLLSDTSAVVISIPHDSWFLAAALPHPRAWGALAVVDGLLYSTAGQADDHRQELDVFDPQADAWSARTPLPTPRVGPAIGVVNGVLYVVGGWTWGGLDGEYRNTLEAYDPVSNTWTTKAPMPTARSDLAVGVIDGVLYAFGGERLDILATVEAYDPATDTWITKAPMPRRRGYFGGAVVDGKFYAVGGHDGNGYVYATDVYDPQADAWEVKAAIPTPRYGLTAVALDGVIYAAGGQLLYDILATVEAYDPSLDSWTSKSPMAVARYLASAGAVAGSMFVVGGWNVSALSSVEGYRP